MLPVTGVIAYILLIRKMRKEQISPVPKASLFALFLIYGTLLMEILLGISGRVSGMSSLGILFLIFVAPVICGIIALLHRNNVRISKYHRIMRRMALAYLLGEATLIGIGVGIGIVTVIIGGVEGV